MTAGGGGASQDPGRLHLPRPVRRPRPHLRQDERHARREHLAGAAAAGALAEPRPRLAVRRRPGRPRVGQVLRGGRHPPEDGQDARRGGDRRQGRLRPPARCRARHAAQKRKAIIPDPRNDENLAVAQTHLAFIRFHNRVVDTLPASVPPSQRFAAARRKVVKHYQWMLRTDYLPRICAPGVVTDVFNNGRKAFEVGVPPTDVPTMPIEFSVAAFRLGHSMIRRDLRLEPDLRGHVRRRSGSCSRSRPAAATWRLVRACPAPGSRTSGGSSTSREAGRADLAMPAAKFNRAMRIDTTLVNPLADLPGLPGRRRHNLAFRNLVAGEDGAARDGAADGHVPEEQGRDAAEQAHERADPRRQQRRGSRRADASRSAPS